MKSAAAIAQELERPGARDLATDEVAALARRHGVQHTTHQSPHIVFQQPARDMNLSFPRGLHRVPRFGVEPTVMSGIDIASHGTPRPTALGPKGKTTNRDFDDVRAASTRPATAGGEILVDEL